MADPAGTRDTREQNLVLLNTVTLAAGTFFNRLAHYRPRHLSGQTADASFALVRGWYTHASAANAWSPLPSQIHRARTVTTRDVPQTVTFPALQPLLQ
jgi:hypothetical protein